MFQKFFYNKKLKSLKDKNPSKFELAEAIAEFVFKGEEAKSYLVAMTKLVEGENSDDKLMHRVYVCKGFKLEDLVNAGEEHLKLIEGMVKAAEAAKIEPTPSAAYEPTPSAPAEEN